VTVEEEQLVVPARLADRAADRVAPVVLVVDWFGIAVPLVDPSVGVPAAVALDVVERSAEAVGAALGDRSDLQTGRPAVLGLVALGEDLHFADGLDVHRQHGAVVAGIHGRDAVHHQVVLRLAAQTHEVRGPARDDTRCELNEAGEVLAVDRQVLDLHRVDRV
jgi:hypothetical protein